MPIIAFLNFKASLAPSSTNVIMTHCVQNLICGSLLKSKQNKFECDLKIKFCGKRLSPNESTKGALAGLRQFLATESTLKMMDNAFYFILKALFVLKIFKFLS